MKKLDDEVENIITKNKMKSVGLYQRDDTLVINFYKVINNDKNLYKTLEITRQENNYKVLILSNNITKILNLEQLEDVIIAIEKECNLKEKTQDEISQIKMKYVKGTKVELIRMNDYLAPVPPKTKGIVEHVDGLGKIHVKWDNETSSLPLIVGLDEFEILSPICGKTLKNKLNNVFKVGEIRPFAYDNIVHFGTIKSIDEEKDIYTLEDIETKEIYQTCSEFVFLGDD